MISLDSLESHAEELERYEVAVSLLDGIQNILPYGVEDALQNASKPVDAYKKCELEADTGLGISH